MADADQSIATRNDTSPHFIRITSGGRIKLWVDFSLRFLCETPGRPLIFHTLPRNPSNSENYATADFLDGDFEQSENADHDQEVSNHKPTISASPRNIPRLISVVEIIKRQYLAGLVPGPQSNGLYQYNHLGYFPSHPDPDSRGIREDQRSISIITALEGKNNLKLEKTPYMSVTLCTKPLPALDGQATCQLPLVKKMSRSAKARQRRRRLVQKDSVV